MKRKIKSLGVMLIVFILVITLTGCGSTQKIECTNESTTNGVKLTAKMVLKGENGILVSIDNEYVFSREDGKDITDEAYEDFLEGTIGVYDITSGEYDESNLGITSFGYDTSVERIGNKIIVKAYQPKYTEEKIKDAEKTLVDGGYTCK